VLAGRRRIALADVADQDFIGLAAGSPLQEHIAQHARQLGMRLRYRVRVRSFEALCRMVEQGIGVGVVPRAAALRCGRSMKIARVALTDAWAARQLLACVRPGEALPQHAQRMLEHLLAG
jgi:DNA-binding transcriptional LysR family regulator